MKQPESIIATGSNSKMTDKHAAECPKAAYLGVNKFVCDVYIVHTRIYPEVSISLTKLPILLIQVNFHTRQVRAFKIGEPLMRYNEDKTCCKCFESS